MTSAIADFDALRAGSDSKQEKHFRSLDDGQAHAGAVTGAGKGGDEIWAALSAPLALDVEMARSVSPRHGLPLLGALWRGLCALGYASLPYGLRLRGQFPSRLLASPSDLWAGDALSGREMLRGIFAHGGEDLSGDAPDFTENNRSSAYRAWLHSFVWLRDLATIGDIRKSRAIAEAAMGDWLIHYSRWDKLAWRPDVIGQRLVSIINHAPLILASQDLVYRSKVLNTMAKQRRHLARTVAMAAPGLPRLRACIGLAFSGLLLPAGERFTAKAMKHLEPAIDDVLLADGMALDRNPETLISVLQALITLRDSFRAARKTPPTFLQVAIDKAASALRGLSMPGFGLPSLNGVSNGGAQRLRYLLDMSESQADPLRFGRQSGYQRLAVGPAVAVLDMGLAPKGALSENAHAGPLALTFCHGEQPIFVNCGTTTNTVSEEGPVPSQALRATAAHSTVVIQDTNAFQVLEKGTIGRTGKSLCAGRDEWSNGQRVKAKTDAYKRRFGLWVSRDAAVCDGGDRFVGRDEIWTASGRAPRAHKAPRVDIRFHLHPSVDVSLTSGGKSALIRADDERWWRFDVAIEGLPDDAIETPIGVDPSLYLDAGDGSIRATKQLVISTAMTAPRLRVSWALTFGTSVVKKA